MSNHNYPRRLLDDAIDRAVHELVHADPRPGFRRRVMTKVNVPAKRSAWTVRYLLPAAAAAAIALLAVWLPLQRSNASAPPTAQIAEQRPTPAPTPIQPAVPGAAASRNPALSARSESNRPVQNVRRGSNRLPSSEPRNSNRREPVPFTFGAPSNRVMATSVTEAATPGPASAETLPSEAADGVTALPVLRITPIEITPIVIKPIEITPIGIRSSPPQP